MRTGKTAYLTTNLELAQKCVKEGISTTEAKKFFGNDTTRYYDFLKLYSQLKGIKDTYAELQTPRVQYNMSLSLNYSLSLVNKIKVLESSLPFEQSVNWQQGYSINDLNTLNKMVNVVKRVNATLDATAQRYSWNNRFMEQMNQAKAQLNEIGDYTALVLLGIL